MFVGQNLGKTYPPYHYTFLETLFYLICIRKTVKISMVLAGINDLCPT